MATKRRILKELDDMSTDNSSGINAELKDGSDIMHLRGSFSGPPDTPYAGGTYDIGIELPDNYPFVPPKMRFETRVWHPNISSQTVCFRLFFLHSSFPFPKHIWYTGEISSNILISTPRIIPPPQKKKLKIKN
jgi:ubiquitin-conjugating enzyme (huntingtin interacting protein 2)